MPRAVIVLALLSSAAGAADLARVLPHEGRLLRADGTPERGSVSMTFRVYSAALGGGADYTETLVVTVNADGYYAVILGAGAALPAFDGRDFWLGVTLAGESEMLPRARMAAVPYALRAQSAAEADRLSATATVPGAQVTGAVGDATRLGSYQAADYLRAGASGSVGDLTVASVRTAPVAAAQSIYPSGPRLEHLAFMRHTRAPILRQGSQPWESGGVYNPWILRDGDHYKLYYTGYQSGVGAKIGLATATATPPAGVDWWAEAQWVRSASNPIISTGGCSGADLGDATVIKIPGDARPYKMWFYGSGSTQFCFADSIDGVSFAVNASPILSRGAASSADSTYLRWPMVLRDTVGGSTLYRMWYGCHNGSWWRICYATSTDGLSWTKPQVNPGASSGYQNVLLGITYFANLTGYAYAQAPIVVKVGEIYYMTLARYTGRTQIVLMMSRDGLAWTEVKTILAPEEYDWGWDGRGMSERASLILDGSRAVLFYGAHLVDWQIGAAVADF